VRLERHSERERERDGKKISLYFLNKRTMALGTQGMATSMESQPEIINEDPPMLPTATNGDKHSPVAADMALWTDEERLKRELVAWAKAVVAMAVHASSVQGSASR
jgi:hypothetical protein